MMKIMVNKKIRQIIFSIIKWFFVVSGVILWLLFFFSLWAISDSDFKTPFHRFLIGPFLILFTYATFIAS